MSNQQEENPIEKMPYGLLISATYKNKKAVLKFYDPKSEKIILWEDKTGHKPYCYTKLGLDDIPNEIAERDDVIEIKPLNCWMYYRTNQSMYQKYWLRTR